MKIISISDLHGDVSRIGAMKEELKRADVVLISGDITNFGGKRVASEVIGALREHASRILAVPGNCDHQEVDEYLSREGLNLHRHGLVLEGVGFAGVGGSLPCPGGTPCEFSEDRIEEMLDEAVSSLPEGIPVILVAHQPPFGTRNDLVADGRHVGSVSVRRFIERHGPLVCFTGHIHEGRGIDEIGGTRVVNPGPLPGGRYAFAEIGEGLETLEIRKIHHGGEKQ